MTDPDEMRHAVAAMAAAFDAMSVSWAIGGSLASAAYGEPRATNDIDLIADITELQARDLVARLGSQFYADADIAADASRRHSCFNVIDQRSFIKVDVFIPTTGALGLGQLERRLYLDIFPGMNAVPVLGPEDVILQKLRWFQNGGEVSERQWRDIVSVLRGMHTEIDLGYIADVCAGTGLTALFERATRDAGSG